MLESELCKFEKYRGKWVSIGVTEDGSSRSSIGVPWISDTSAYMMRLPSIYITPEDTQNEEILSLFDECTVVGFYIWESLPDYSFLARFPDIDDLSIKCGVNINDISFLRSLKKCRMLFLQDARFMNLDPILDTKEENTAFPPCYTHIGLDNCYIGNISRLFSGDYFFSEFLVWNPVSRGERDRWSMMKQRGFRYYEYK